ncbi:hypothetical protein [Schlesneria sp. DSM 10557]|uniref:hypothetical protein n=1 Tax=Schlesneria sp. DSM 10557 TaxID=3044399 RepID=UPI00359F4F95
MRSITCLTFIACQLVLGVCRAEETTANMANRTLADIRKRAHEQEHQVLKSLSRRITLDVKDEPLVDVIRRISRHLDRDILLHSESLADAGIDADQSVDLHLGELTTWQALHFLLEPLALSWTAKDGVIEVSSRDKIEETRITRVYDVRRLSGLLDPISKELPWRNRARHRGVGNPVAEMGGFGGGAIGGGGGMFNIPSAAIHFITLAQVGMGGGVTNGANSGIYGVEDIVPMSPRSVESLLAKVISQFPGMKWEDIDGEGGTVETSPGFLIVTQHYHAQFVIEAFLKTLEQSLEGSVAGQSIPIHRSGYPIEDDNAIFAALSRRQVLEIDHSDLNSVLEMITQEAGIRIRLDRPALANEGISADQEVNIMLNDLPLGIGLSKILDPLRLAYFVEEGVVVISTKDVAVNHLTLRLHDISNIPPALLVDSEKGLGAILIHSTTGRWYETSGEGGFAALLSSKHLLVSQTQDVQTEIELLVRSLNVGDQNPPSEPELSLRVYTTADMQTADDLVDLLPRIIGNTWSGNGEIHRTGRSLLIKQTTLAHEKIHTIIQTLNRSQERTPASRFGPVTAPAAVVRPPVPPSASGE